MSPAVSALLGGATLWGLSWWPIKALNASGLNGVLLTLIAYGAAAVVILPVAMGQRHHWRHRLPIMFFILSSGGLWSLLFVLAVEGGSASRVVLLYYLSTVWMIVGARVLLRERIGIRRCACVLLGIAGAALVIGIDTLLTSEVSIGDWLAIAAGIAQAVTCLAYRVGEDIPVTSKNAFMLVGSVAAAGAALMLSPEQAPLHTIPPGTLVMALLFGACWLLVAETMVQFGISHLPASRSAILLLSELPITFISAALIAGERLTINETWGAALILLAALIECSQAPASEQAPTPLTRRLPSQRAA